MSARRTLVGAIVAVLMCLGLGVPSASASTCDTIPLPSGHYYGLNDGTPYSHSGLTSTDQYNIKKIQRVINSATNPDVAVDGRFGYATRDGVKRFQAVLRSYGEPVAYDGEYGRQTWYSAWNQGWGGFQC
ncbi:peptidoglycan-binding domain-containing protein [Luteipulveratus sp. YIM 133132]|uniref:peptidoglycan-binding domain-containing protein n=1 Tax=Luteipulveratus flavus TaxID=3031728 RepID=UPI0023AFB452|nr:peptidoglycan-binding domain-containing protein [Luteipulveratus sp. YIM 133132]MDE9365974.1 peptidoglycan-binding domain-containing protein [Luteipulveratus sp. YIM 133132]